MASKEGKFGTFGGVFTPSILTILGVIMYLRLPWVVGNAGLIAACVIIAIAHVISICTGLSISSIATDKSVGAGGPYYIVSRSLGLPIGGTLGLALFVGLAFSISLYVIGFSESFLSYWELDSSVNSIRICGTITIVVLTIVTFISTALAIKTQYIILTLIALSLASIFMGTTPAPETPHLRPLEGGDPMPFLFGIFFPAVTGFTAGVNMSGDLENPKKSIPRGTMAAILSGAIVYFGLAIYLSFRVTPAQLVDNPNILLDIALIDWLVVAGIWGATVSSALGSILGAPRILQAVSVDRITPRFFAKGHGKTNEPRNALFLAFAIGEAGILIGELNAIARIVSMVFLATYGFLNISCAIESWASPDFRPAFRIPKWVSLLGAVTCIVVMIQLDLVAMLASSALMAGLFAYLQRRQLRLESGDTWEGIWSSLVRSGLFRLSREARQSRNWRPNILAFGANPDREGFEAIGESLLGSTGMVTYMRLVKTAEQAKKGPETPTSNNTEAPPLGVFHRSVVADDPLSSIPAICKYHGLAGIEPNTVLLHWQRYGEDAKRLADLLRELADLGLNQVIYSRSKNGSGPPDARIDVWWREGGGNLNFSLSLVRFLTVSPHYEDASVRFLLLSDDPANNDILRATTRRHLTQNRVDAAIRVVNNTMEARTYEECVRQESTDAKLTILALPNEPTRGDSDFLTRLSRLFATIGDALVFRASSDFEEVLSTGRPASISLLPPSGDDADGVSLPPVRLPYTPDLAQAAWNLTERYRTLVLAFDEHCVARIYGANVELVRRLKGSLERQLTQLDKALGTTNVRRQQQLLNRAQSSFLMEAQQILGSFVRTDLTDQRATLEGRIEAFLQDDTVVPTNRRERLLVQRTANDFARSKNDSPYLRRFKRRRRWASVLRRDDQIAYSVPIGALQHYYFHQAVDVLLRQTVTQLVADSHQLAVQLGKILSSSKTSLSFFAELGEDANKDLIAEQRQRVVKMFDDLVRRSKKRVDEHRERLLAETAGLLQQLSDDLERLDVNAMIKKERRAPKDQSGHGDLTELPEAFYQNQSHLFERAKLAVKISGFQHRLVTVVRRQEDAIALQIKNGTLSDYRAVKNQLEQFLLKLDKGDKDAILNPKFNLEFKNRFDPKQVVESLMSEAGDAAADLPETVTALSDESIELLEEGKIDAADLIELSLRRLAQFLVETELIGGIQDELESIPELERRAITIAQDVVRLLSFQLNELESVGPMETADIGAQVKPVVENGLQRIEGELGQLEEILPRLTALIEEHLQAVIEGTSPYELTRSSENLEQHIRLHQSKKAVSEAHGFLRRTSVAARQAMVSTLYRASAGVVLARSLKARASGNGTVVDRVLTFVADNSPRPDVIRTLPFFYRQLFLGQSLNETFWVGRQDQVAKARRAMQSYREGSHGAILVTGEHGSGKTALCQRLSARVLEKRPLYWVRPPRGGSIEERQFKSALAAAVELSGSYKEIFDRLPEGAVLMFDDLELWWERSQPGLAVIDLVLDLVGRYGDRALFIFGVSRHALGLINRFRPVTDAALTVLECEPMAAESLGSIIMLRHGSTGVKFELGGKQESELSQWQLARLFSHHFNYSRGIVGAALTSWLTHVEKAGTNSLVLRTPEGQNAEDLDGLKLEWTALLLELSLHKQLTRKRLERVAGLGAAELDRELAPLIRMGLIVEDRGVLEVNRYVHHLVADRFERRGLLQ